MVLSLALLSGCRQSAGWQFVPDRAVAVAALNPEGIFLANLSLDRNPVLPGAHAPRLMDLLSGPKAYIGVVYGYKLAHHKDVTFFVGCTDSPKHAEQLLLSMSFLAGDKHLQAASRPMPDKNLTLTAVYAEKDSPAAARLLDSLQAIGPQSGQATRLLSIKPGEISLVVPDVATCLGHASDTSFARGSLLVQANLLGGQSRAGFTFIPAPGNPLHGRPIFDNHSRLHPWARDPADTGATELVMRMRKADLMPRLQQDRRYRVMELMAGLFRIPATELIASAGSDAYFRSEGAASPGYSLTLSVGNPKRMEQVLRGMVRQGSLSGPRNRNLLGNQSAMLYTHGGLLTFKYKDGRYPKAFGQRDGVSLSLRANASFIRSLGVMMGAERQACAEMAAGLVRNLSLEMLNRDDGSFTGHVEVEHKVDLARLAEEI